MQVKRVDYIQNTNSIRLSFSNNDVVDINLKEYIQKGNKLSLISKTGKRIPFSNNLQSIVNLNISALAGILEFNRSKYRELISTVKKSIQEHKREFYEARDCVEWAFSNVDKDVYRLLGTILSDAEYMKLLELATVKRT